MTDHAMLGNPVLISDSELDNTYETACETGDEASGGGSDDEEDDDNDHAAMSFFENPQLEK